MKLIENIKQSFRHRALPAILTTSSTLNEDELQEVDYFRELTNATLVIADLEKNFEILNWLTPQAYCYFLSQICIVGYEAQRTDLLIYDSIIIPLDRSSDPNYWDEFFIERWGLLTSDELDAMQEWLLWLAEEDSPYDDVSLSRSFDTLEALKGFNE